MDFNSILQACYKKDINPFMLYSTMSDLCKGDFELKEQANILYKLYMKKDVFEEILSSTRETFELKLKEYSDGEINCLTCVARLLHSEWNLSCANKTSVKKQGKLVRAQQIKTVVSKRFGEFSIKPQINVQKNAQKNALNNTPALVPKKAKNPKKKTLKGIWISSLVSDLDVEIVNGIVDVEVWGLQKGRWSKMKKYLLKRVSTIYMNLDSLIIDRIKVSIPKDKYGELYINKLKGTVNVIDGDDCFKKVHVTLQVGKINCSVSASEVCLVDRAGEIECNYNALHTSKIDLKNTLGDVKLKLNNVGLTQEKILAIMGNTFNSYVPCKKGFSANLKVETHYGNVYVA